MHGCTVCLQAQYDMTQYNYEIYFVIRMLVSVLQHGYEKYLQTVFQVDYYYISQLVCHLEPGCTFLHTL
jgi:hypothetical protein